MSEVTKQDVETVIKIIDICAKRGAFEGSELLAVGVLRDKFAQLYDKLKKQEEISETHV